MKPITLLVLGLLLIPSVSFAAPLTNDQANSLISVVQSSPTTPASAFTNLITAFSSITVAQAESLITVVQAAPGVPANAFVSMLLAFTVDPQPLPVQNLGSVQSVVNNTSTPVAPMVESVAMTPNWTIKIIPENGDTGKRNVEPTVKIGGFLKLWLEVYDKNNKFLKTPVTITTNDPDFKSPFVINLPIEEAVKTGGNYVDFVSIQPKTVGTFDFTFTVEDVSKTVQVTVVE